MMKLGFIQAPAWGRDCPPYTMCFLAALVRQRGHAAYLFDLNNILYHTSPQSARKMWDDKDYYSHWEDIESVSSVLDINKKAVDFYVNEILKTDARIIGFTVQFSSVLASLEIARRIKKYDNSRIIVFGGPDCSLQQKGDYLIRQDCVDIVVHGEGEIPLNEIIRNIDCLKQIDSIKGCLLLRGNGISYGGYVPGPENLDTMPAPDYSDFKDDINSRMYREPHRIDIFDSRGCPMHCHFCSEWQFWGKFRSKSGEKIYKEMVQHMNDFPQVNYFYFIGSLVNGDMDALDNFCNLVITSKLKIQWAAQAIIRPEMTKEFLTKMKRSGCVWISYGIESGSQEVLNKMNKRFSLELASRVLRDTKESGIAIQANFMFGLPTETISDFKHSINFLKANRKYIDTILASQSFCVIDKGSYLYNHPEEFGIKNREHHLFWESNDGENNYPERFRRYEEFCKLALSMGLPETSGILRHKPDKWQLFGDYYYNKGNYSEAIENYLKAGKPGLKSGRLNKCYEKTGDYNKAAVVLSRNTELVMEKNFSLIESIELKEVLQYLSNTSYKGVNLEKIIRDLKFDEKQQLISRILYSRSLWTKLSNYILIEVQKSRRETFLFGYPYWLVIDPCNYCNLHCPFCPTGQERGARVKAKLSFDLFKDTIDKIGPYLIHVDLVNWGEPFLNERIFDMIGYAKQHHCYIKTDTNLNCLDEEKVEKIVLSGLDRIVLSIDGLTEKTYSRYRKGGDFRLVMENLKLLLRKRKELNSNKPYITWQFLVFRHNEHEINKLKKLGKDFGVDEVGITKAFIGDKDWIPLNEEYSHYKNQRQREETKHTSEYFKPFERGKCNWPWESIVVNPNGSVSVCCSAEEEKDDFGNILNDSLDGIWNNLKYSQARKYIKDEIINGETNKNICFNCQHKGLTNLNLFIRD